MTMPNIKLKSKFVNNMTPEQDRFVTVAKLNKRLRDTNYEQLYAYLQQDKKHAAYDRLLMERFTPTMTNDPLALVSNVKPFTQSSQAQVYQYPSSSENHTPHVQSSLYPPSTEKPQPNSGYTQTEKMIDNLSNQVALLVQQFRATLPQTNNQLRTSTNPCNQEIVEEGRVVVQNVQGRQNLNQRNFARDNGAAGNGGVQNRVGNANQGQVKQTKCYNCGGLRHTARNCTQLKASTELRLLQREDAFDESSRE